MANIARPITLTLSAWDALLAQGQEGGPVANTATQQNSHRQFRAFVSYSHADKAAAQKLHHKLEAYRLPKHLCRRSEQDSPDNRIGPIFRDREDLPAAEDLTESVKQALAKSEALVVLCSPNAQKSPWVSREIELFRELHPDRLVLAALLEGEPEEAFPAPLREGREPLAADLRKDGDGPRLGFLKVVAGIAGVPLDALVNRDAQRRVKRVTAITVVAVAAMVVMALMTTFAIQQRNEARQQREAAEELVEFMLDDLREELKGVGRLEIMSGVNERALAHYASQGDLGDLPADSLQRRARILHIMGEDDEKVGNLEAALETYQEAQRTTSSLVERDPGNPDFLFAETQSLLYLALYRRNEGQNALAISLNRKAQRLSEKLGRIRRDDRFIEQAATVHGNLCAISVSANTLGQDAERNCRRSLSLKQEIADSNPSDFQYLSDLANQHAWYGDFLVRQNRTSEGMAQLDRHLVIVDQLMKTEPDNWQWVEQGTRSRIGYAEILFKLDQVKRGHEVGREAVKLAEKLVRHDTENARWESLLKRARLLSR